MKHNTNTKSSESNQEKKLFEITIKAYKTFYVYADSVDDAYQHERVEDEQSSLVGDVEWEVDETDANEITDTRKHVEKHYKKLILE